MRLSKTTELYSNRTLLHGYPNLEKLGHQWYVAEKQKQLHDDSEQVNKLVSYFRRLVDLGEGASVLVVGCGPQPTTVSVLLEQGFKAIGVEPVPSLVATAREYLGGAGDVRLGTAEDIPVEDEGQDVVILDSVFEHVDSPVKSLNEAYRVLRPGGVIMINTTNRHRFSLLGRNGEFNVPFYNWFPALLKECYVHHHLHYKPSLSNYSTRPAVHWYTYAELCKLGRDAGFSRFYSILDVLRPEDPGIMKSRLRRWLLPRLQRRPWLRALALTQVGGIIFMVKRPSDG
jgi:ubiquinone/menaquinone biosynthesis C-methylase UbiE